MGTDMERARDDRVYPTPPRRVHQVTGLWRSTVYLLSAWLLCMVHGLGALTVWVLVGHRHLLPEEESLAALVIAEAAWNGVVLLVWYHLYIRPLRLRRAARWGEETRGQITAVMPGWCQWASSLLTYTFTTAAGERVEATQSVPARFCGGACIGQGVTVLYNASKPRLSVLCEYGPYWIDGMEEPEEPAATGAPGGDIPYATAVVQGFEAPQAVEPAYTVPSRPPRRVRQRIELGRMAVSIFWTVWHRVPFTVGVVVVDCLCISALLSRWSWGMLSVVLVVLLVTAGVLYDWHVLLIRPLLVRDVMTWGEATRGSITGIYPGRSDREDTALTYCFTTADGRYVQGRQGVPRRMCRGARVGEQVTIIYHPKLPRWNAMCEYGRFWVEPEQPSEQPASHT